MQVLVSLVYQLSLDDKMPYAYEEIWTYTGASNGLRAAGGMNAIGYKNTFAGYTCQ